jgi:MFS family permease
VTDHTVSDHTVTDEAPEPQAVGSLEAQAEAAAARGDPAAAELDAAQTDAGATTAPTKRNRGDGVMHNRDFVKVWVGESISLTGTEVTQFALPLIAILTLKVSTFQVGLLNATRYAPVVVISLFAGVWLDRRRRRPILLTCSLINAVLIGLIPLAYELHFLSMGLLYALCLTVGTVTVLFDVGALSLIPCIVEERHLAESNSMIQTSTAMAGIVGPGLAGFLVGILGAPVALVADAASYVCSALGLGSIKRPEPEPEKPEVRPSVRSDIHEGLRAVWGTPLLMGLLTQSATFNFFQNGFITIFMVYGIRYLHLTPFRLGLVVSGIAVGGVFGAMYANRIRERIGFGHTVWLATVVSAVCPLLLLIPKGHGFLTVVVLAFIEAVFGFCLLAFNVNTVTVRQRITPKRLLGRMNASYRMILFGTGPIGAVLGGWLGSVVGLRTGLIIAAISLITPLAWVAFSPVFRMRDMPEPVADYV